MAFRNFISYTLLSKDFLVLVTIAFAIAIPITYLAMHSWLEGFVYRMGLPRWIIASAGILAIFIAQITVGLQALKAALANPITSLHS